MKNNIVRNVFSTAVILLVPLLMKWPWTVSDFVISGVLIFGTGIAIEVVKMKVKSTTHRVVIIVAIVAAFLLVWAELAVGLFGTPFAGS